MQLSITIGFKQFLWRFPSWPGPASVRLHAVINADLRQRLYNSDESYSVSASTEAPKIG